ncbi:MAG: hypothetical protein KIT11_09315 [Fimbriimonadaceae bacterium]|nr:hypothetical protein [Fimbriimonadaceae bacterium]QYK55526.1 MAG: hypothetical protein KF733_10985 [Fimbriimonadaceae bacterium]
MIKLLSVLTLGLHFSAVMILVGSLVLVIWLNVRARSAKDVGLLGASYTLAKRLPVVMTFVINLGVPPLLFVQVLYGQQIYSSSVLIGAVWFSILLLLMLSYWLLYRTIAAMEKGRAAWHIALFTLLIVLGIGQIYAFNMTLMLHPEVWQAMYQKSPVGLQGFSGDPTTSSRWLFVMSGGPLIGGLWAALLSNMVYLQEGVRNALRRSGGMLAGVGALPMLFFGWRIVTGQPEHVLSAIMASPMHQVSLLASAATILLGGLLGLVQGLGKTNTLIGSLGLVLGLVANVAAGIVRDGIRDFTLQPKGFDVNLTPVYPNWSVLVVFLLLFVAMLGVVYWLLQVMRKATPPTEEVAL